MQANTSGDPYAAAETYCDGLSLGGYDDWRLPTAGEIVSIFKCDGSYPPVRDVFTVSGDGTTRSQILVATPSVPSLPTNAPSRS